MYAWKQIHTEAHKTYKLTHIKHTFFFSFLLRWMALRSFCGSEPEWTMSAGLAYLLSLTPLLIGYMLMDFAGVSIFISSL